MCEYQKVAPVVFRNSSKKDTISFNDLKNPIVREISLSQQKADVQFESKETSNEAESH